MFSVRNNFYQAWEIRETLSWTQLRCLSFPSTKLSSFFISSFSPSSPLSPSSHRKSPFELVANAAIAHLPLWWWAALINHVIDHLGSRKADVLANVVEAVMLRTPVRETSGRLSFPFKSKITFIKLEFFFYFILLFVRCFTVKSNLQAWSVTVVT